ncbi:hypothetical protein ARAM_004535 [Aspergillus rambellii]|uniref:Major facilitator superfamily (MFS) profile domain-containing protein n=1 Tax=Aspergillus rambellii TaxID=308745 RepID=A0A0F8UWG1_9EURO|nr:hypothetical protein ARAM_004535 [Aspergillus rambellii]
MLLYGRIVPVTPTALHERVGLSEGDAEMDINLVLGGPLDESVSDQPENAVRKEKRNSALYTLLAADRILVSVWAYFILSVILTSFDSVLPLFVEETFHWKQTAQGLIFIPLTVPHVFDPLVGYINDRYEEARRYLAAGPFFGAVPVLVLLRLVTDNSMHHKILLCALLALLGICLAIIITPVMVEASYVVKEKEEETPDVFGKGGAMALAYGVLNSAFAAGGLVGPFLAGFIRNSAGWGDNVIGIGVDRWGIRFHSEAIPGTIPQGDFSEEK